MRLRSPAEFYIKFLFLHPDKYSAEDVQEMLIDKGLHYISQDYLARVKKKLRPPKVFRPFDLTHSPSFRFIVKEGLYTLFAPTSEMKMALSILQHANARLFVESTILNTPHEPIALAVTRNYHLYCNTGALRLYKHYFYNFDAIDNVMAGILHQLKYEMLQDSVPELKGKDRILKMASYRDPRRIAFEQPASPNTTAITQVELGMRLPKQDTMQLLQANKELALVRGLQILQENGPQASMNALNLAGVVRIYDELIESTARPESEILAQVSTIALRSDPNPVKSIHALSAGNHTVDMAPPQEAEEDDSPPIPAEGK